MARMALCAEAAKVGEPNLFVRKVFAAASKTFANHKELSMKTTTKAVRRSLAAVFAASAVGGASVAALMGSPVPSATAATDPCAASELARTIGSVATSTGNYLDTHPQTNQALTTISQQQAGPQSLGAIKTYFDANPQAAKDMQQLQQPLVNMSTRCKVPISLPQLMGLMQAAQQQGGALPGSLPGALQTAQTAGIPGAAPPASPSPASAVAQGSGPQPGPSATTTR
jgi:hemophore